ncbi:pyruvate, water dikinase regulatory protein [Psychrosphaera haliotis]|uniref:Putative phosphoenolpyruvate synthase regulatory protein n=1 Tax=Psychrosphaera haliotis TaxID=555083 RepID=A0A6N8F836_9GAMM|nr:pyruvate, water dikinase regulatory protein [Psychrosphaera haliotis]MDB2373664.1 kinase/pyrophosphorylase [Psychrosphaera haliotis]MUH71032.1 pyruvate, phosphate dikinase/phosphoenolpyruvate synthase regulator [Psychrosphaera haliotis]
MTRTAFYVSDGTAITAETIGHATLSQYDFTIEHITVPFIESDEKANLLKEQINRRFKTTGHRPFVFHTFVDKSLAEKIADSHSICFDVLEPFSKVISDKLNVPANPVKHRTHSIKEHKYDARIEAMNFALTNDDGQTTDNYKDADVILVGVSRSGKTPTSIYLALQYGIKAANYPFTEDDMEDFKLSAVLKENKRKIFGLTIEPNRLAAIRNERYANSKYASLRQCRMELREVERMYKGNKIPFINTTHFSVEEISAKIISAMKLARHNH